VSFVVLDTDVSSASLRGRLADPLRARLTGQTWCISFVTVGELTKWTVLRNWGPAKLASLADWRTGGLADWRTGGLADWRRHVVTLPYSEQVAVRWGELQARAERRGRPRPVNDTWIAASCLVRELPLATLNIKDFADFADHDGLRIIGVNER
jgi:toxin FitB